ncbi:hypothetical protein ZWY2020_002965 [Hordeum vulgare]|nr:hypothetical protein ZWY2020_002965 [Hordeum vulgare]
MPADRGGAAMRTAGPEWGTRPRPERRRRPERVEKEWAVPRAAAEVLERWRMEAALRGLGRGSTASSRCRWRPSLPSSPEEEASNSHMSSTPVSLLRLHQNRTKLW